MTNFREKFLTEALNLIISLETSAIELKENPEDENVIYNAFRAIHSLKGGGAMFGFEEISNFSEALENEFDKVRLKEKIITNELLKISIDSVAHLRNLLKDDAGKDKQLMSYDKELTEKILKL